MDRGIYEKDFPLERRCRSQPYSSLQENWNVDVAIVGGGVTGITAGYLLAKAGKSVAVLEAWEVGGGTTGFSTGNLYAIVGEMLRKSGSSLIRKRFVPSPPPGPPPSNR